uniref:DUF4585 domain-containing protein n=2 Tax=Knipowitschia caucasica TaxID=637954 RepID=A0AAV2LV71_KNICA
MKVVDTDMMSCVEKRHMSHRMGAMLHHRFPNGFTDLFMDETDREVSTLTDRAFRSLCIGDDAVYNDEFTYGYSPFSCHKPLAGEPHKKTKENKKQSRSDKYEGQPWNKHQHKTMSQMSSFLKALSATEGSYEGMFKKNGVTDSNGESWDKSALRSIQKELSDFSADYEGHYKNPSGNPSTNKESKDNSLSKNSHFKANVKLKKLNIKNFFLHSEFSPFQAWADMNRFSFGHDTIVSSILPEEPEPKWYDLSFYKQLTEAPQTDTAVSEPTHSCQREVTEAPPPPAPTEPKPIPPPVPPKVLPKPSVTAAEKRCTSEGGDGPAAPWRRNRGSLTGSDTLVVDDKTLDPPEIHEELKELADATRPLDTAKVEDDLPPPARLILPTSRSPPNEILKVQDQSFLMVPEQEGRFSGVSPQSEEVDSTAGSTVEIAEEGGLEGVLSKVPSERSGSTCSGNDSQTGLPKPPAVLPKTEKAVLKAIKLTNRRIKKEEAHTSHKSSHSSSKHKSDRHKSDKSSSSSSSRNPKSGERKHKEKSIPKVEDNAALSSHNLNDLKEIEQPAQRQSVESGESSRHRDGFVGLSERQGRSSDRRAREKPEHRHYSSDRIISNVPVYKNYAGDKTSSERPFQRSMSTDRYMESKVQRRLSADMSNYDRVDPRSQRIEKSIVDELQQRGRQKERQSKENPLRRSHSIDAQSTAVLHPANLSRQSSLSSQLSRQSSIEHAIVASSFPITQRKLLQDPDSGQYFFVDMPVQVKTKTFFDPETGTYVQLPVQPPEGAIPQPSPMEVLSPPLMVYHSFVPVSLSPMTQAAPEQLIRHSEGHPYLEPVFGQHEHVLGEFLGTEELDCPS